MSFDVPTRTARVQHRTLSLSLCTQSAPTSDTPSTALATSHSRIYPT